MGLIEACREAIEAEIKAAIENPEERNGAMLDVLRSLIDLELKSRQPNPIEWSGVFTLPPTLNVQLRGSAYQRAASKKKWTRLSRLEARSQGCPVFSGHVWLQCTYLVHNLQWDMDNLTAGLKPLLDGLTPERVKGVTRKGTGFINDDSLAWLTHEKPIAIKIPNDSPEQIIVRLRNWG